MFASDHETWLAAEVRSSRVPRRCVFCESDIRVGSSIAVKGSRSAHYACAPGLGSPVYREVDWTHPVVGGHSSLGGRTENQDRFGVASFGVDQVRIVVADGMGGHADGARAAQIAVDEALRRPFLRSVEFAEVHRKVCSGSIGGTTLTLVDVVRAPSRAGSGEGRSVWFGQVGDSTGAVFRIRPRRGRPALVERIGATVPQGIGNRLFSCLGAPNRGPVTPVFTSLSAKSGDVCVVYSDGCNPAFEDSAGLRSLFSRWPSDPLSEIAVRLTEAAHAAGGTDNATVLLFRIP